MSVWLSLLASPFLTRGSLATFIISLVLFLAIRKLRAFLRFFRQCQSLPGDKEYSLLYGNTHLLPPNYEGILAVNQDYMTNVSSQLRRFWLGPWEAVVALFHPGLIKELVKTRPPKTRGFGGAYEHSMPWMGESVLNSDGHRWNRDRSLINNAFHYNILKNYVAVFNSAADTLLSIIDEHAEKDQSFDIFNLASLCLFDIITKSTMSLDLNPQRSKHPYVAATKKLAAIWALRNKTLSLWPDILFRLSKAGRTFFEMCKYVHKVDEEMINKRRNLMVKDEEIQSKHLDFLDLLLYAKDVNGNTMTAKEVRENVDALMFAGHDTGSASVSWFLYQMALKPHHQRKVHEEIDSVMADRKDNSVLGDDMNSFPYLTMCLKESMRLNPAVPTLSRRLDRDTPLGDFVLPAGAIVTLPIIYIHRNPEIWNKPLEYIPERFSRENRKKIDPHAYIPFSVGSRNCPGQHFAMMELKVVLVKLLRQFEFDLDPNAPHVERVYELIMKAKKGIWLTAKRRNI